MDNRIILALLAVLALGFIGMIIIKPWVVPKNIPGKWKRSLVVGFFTSLAVLISMIILGWNNENIYIGSNFFRTVGGLFICLGLPVGVIATIGFYISYRQLEWLLKKKDEISRRTNSKK